ncbi:hypothetical protein BCD49_06845 [Pseudofrankia sp. EUN1h]|nr:hypothetical protein BCD49_06845 [Pseudofrankia sp. EUN1h]
MDALAEGRPVAQGDPVAAGHALSHTSHRGRLIPGRGQRVPVGLVPGPSWWIDIPLLVFRPPRPGVEDAPSTP